MPIVYDKLFAELGEAGITKYRLRKERVVGQATLNALLHGRDVSTGVIARFCGMLGRQPGDLMEYVPDDAPKPDGAGSDGERDGID